MNDVGMDSLRPSPCNAAEAAKPPVPTRLIALDVGAGTTDIVIRSSDEPPENSVKLVVPSQTRVVAARIRAATLAGAAVVFFGRTMGGGADTRAMKAHTAASLPFVATPAAARSFADDLERVRACGVEIVPEDEATALIRAGHLPSSDKGRRPGRRPGAGRRCAAGRQVVGIRAGDLDAAALITALQTLGVPTDFHGAAIAVQDHGFTPDGSNRAYRFSVWEHAVRCRRRLTDLFYRADRGEVPERLTRLQAAVACLTELLAASRKGLDGRDSASPQAAGAPEPGPDRPLLAADTGPAALLGALVDAPAADDPGAPRVLVNVGNGHTIAVVERDGRLAGVYEHHTGMLDAGRLQAQLRRFLTGRLTAAEVRADGGHGAILDEPVGHDVTLLVTGPNRRLLNGSGFRVLHPAPWGDMMIAGAVGLLEAFRTHLDR